MTRLVLPVSALLAGVALLMLGSGLLSTLVGVRLGTAGQGSLASGLVVSGYFLGLVAGALVAHRVVQAVGHIRAFTALASLFSAASLAHAFLDDPLLWWSLRVVEGMCMAGLFMCAESWLNERAENETRGTILSLYTLTAGIGTGLGQFLLMVADVRGFALFALSSVLLSMAVVPVALTRSPGPTIPAPSRLDLGGLWRVSPLGVAGCAASGLVLGAFYGMAPLFGQALGLDAAGIAGFMGAAIVGGMALQWPMGRLSDRIDRRLAILAVAGGLAAASGAVAGLTVAAFGPDALARLPLDADMLPDPAGIVHHFHRWITPLAVVFGAFAFTLYPLGVAQANDHATHHDFVAVSGGLVLSYSVGAVAGPVLAAGLMEAAGPGGLFAFTAAIGATLGLFTLWRMQASPAVPAADQTPFQPVPRTSLVAYALDPRHEDDQLSFDFAAPADGAALGPAAE